jgi:hypothetical protein
VQYVCRNLIRRNDLLVKVEMKREITNSSTPRLSEAITSGSPPGHTTDGGSTGANFLYDESECENAKECEIQIEHRIKYWSLLEFEGEKPIKKTCVHVL